MDGRDSSTRLSVPLAPDVRPHPVPSGPPLEIGMLVFPGMTALGFVAPHQLFARLTPAFVAGVRDLVAGQVRVLAEAAGKAGPRVGALTQAPNVGA